MSKKTFIILFVVLAVTIVGVLVTIFLIRDKKDDSTKVPISTISPSDTVNKTTIPKMDGESELSNERKEILDKNIISQIKAMEKGVLMEDENGNYLTDENGQLLYEGVIAIDYSNVENNLSVIINAFADKNYTDEAIRQIQRYYYQYCWTFVNYPTDEIIEKIALCFPSDGTDSETLTKKANEVFGQNRKDGFAFVFEETPDLAEIKVEFNNVKAWGNTSASEKYEWLCVHDYFYSDEVYDRNLEGWLHKIINEMSDYGYGEKEILIAQLLYVGSLSVTEYRYDLIDCMRQCISIERELTTEELKENVQRVFDVDIENNLPLMQYLDGETVYGGAQ